MSLLLYITIALTAVILLALWSLSHNPPPPARGDDNDYHEED